MIEKKKKLFNTLLLALLLIPATVFAGGAKDSD